MSRVGVDIGGTFTDVVWMDSSGDIHFDKAFSTPNFLYKGVMEGVGYLVERGRNPQEWLKEIDRFAHGTTASTNALIERKGAKVGLVTTRGFEDTLIIGRATVARTGGLPLHQAMDFIYTEPPTPLVPRELVRGVNERVTADGRVLVAPDPSDVKTLLTQLLEMGIESLAVVLLWSFRNSAHEQLVRDIAKELSPTLQVSLSSVIAPHIGEFERMVTTVANAYVAPISRQYLDRLGTSLSSTGFRKTLHVMTATGGTILPADVENMAVSLINSGPVGGLIAARHLGESLGWNNLITADMGGTSFDVGVIANGRFEIEESPFLAHGLPSKLPAVKIVTIGAGGGSIAWTDGHRLYVGPESAGSEPGPACYGRGGTQPTVTDALVVMGILHPQRFFSGRCELDSVAALSAIDKFVAAPLGLDVHEAADGIYKVVTSKMADLIRKASVEQGNDPRNFRLCAYGGAAGAHAALLMEQLGIPAVIIPYAASVFSALGISLSDILYSASKSFPLTVAPTDSFSSSVKEAFEDLTSQVQLNIADSGIELSNFVFAYELDVRYKGQINSVRVNWNRPSLAVEEIPQLRLAFHNLYERRFGKGSTHENAGLELIGFRLYALSPQPKPGLQHVDFPSELLKTESRQVFSREHGWMPARVISFDSLPAEQALLGPAIIERRDTTVWTPAGFSAMRDTFGNIILSRQGAQYED